MNTGVVYTLKLNLYLRLISKIGWPALTCVLFTFTLETTKYNSIYIYPSLYRRFGIAGSIVLIKKQYSLKKYK